MTAGPVAGLRDFVRHCRRADGGVRPNPDPRYGGNSDTALSGAAAPAYALILEETLGFRALDRRKTGRFLAGGRGRDGLFRFSRGEKPPMLLYDTLQALLGLRIAGGRLPAGRESAARAVARLYRERGLEGFPFYALDFYGQFFSVIGKRVPPAIARAVLDRYEAAYRGGEVGGHVASTFHFVHFSRLLGRPVPHAGAILERTLALQKRDGSFNRMPDPAWDVHATFDACFIIRQLGRGGRCSAALARAARWALSCRNPDGGFGHFPGRPSDLDACYFQAGTLVMGGFLPARRVPDGLARALGWGHLFPVPPGTAGPRLRPA